MADRDRPFSDKAVNINRFTKVTRRKTMSLTIWDDGKFLLESRFSGKRFVRVSSEKTASTSVFPEISPTTPEKPQPLIEFSSRQHS
jgi:hypothetical protein